jgi:hypothetical protein
VAIRQEVVKTMGHILDFYTGEKKQANAGNMKKMLEVLLRSLDTQADAKEVSQVQNSAIFSLRYLYPLDKGYDAYQKEAVARLIQVVKVGAHAAERNNTPQPGEQPANNPGTTQKKPVVDEEVVLHAIETLTILTRKPFGQDMARWEEWWDGQQKKISPR